jgi:hypothetical protein
MNLTATTHSLELVTSTAVSTTFTVSWLDVDKSGASTVATPGSNHGTIASATTTTIVAAPGASIYRTIMSLSIVASGTQVASVQKDVSATNYPMSRGSLVVNESLNYEDGNGWYVLNADGSRKGVGANGTAGTNGGGTVLGSGTSIVNFGAGALDATLVVTGQAAILAGSLVYCWIKPEATIDHSSDEHLVEPLRVFASNVIAGVGFTLNVFSASELISEKPPARLSRFLGTGQDAGPGQAARNNLPNPGGQTPLISGQYSVGWLYTQ